ncbi:hypothetical protein EJ08DRAFT_700032 [Tothia fuscella]|uniref:Uncharacterized protein n=1 Tax=Tothia fuscella TaxID=1048955 RepID=A0A9P4NLN7_9PEZI|nr:hypothetical protein EJ08DRAFT_700032 [Tothia fuscella]
MSAPIETRKPELETTISETSVAGPGDLKHRKQRHRTKSRNDVSVRGPEQYALAAHKLAHRSTTSTSCPGVHFEKIAEFLNAPYRSNNRGRYAPSLMTDVQQADESFITVYHFTKDEPPHSAQIRTKDDLITDACGPFSPNCTGRMIFMRGYQHADWLNTIGSRYNVDYEFFRRHMDFETLKPLSDTFSRPTLPSAFSNVMQLSISSLSAMRTAADPATVSYQAHLKQQRKDLESLMPESLGNLANPHKTKGSYGDSIVRRLVVHGSRYFSIEQDISFFVGSRSDEFIILVWSDCGENLCRDTLAFNLQCDPDDVWCLPTIQHVSAPAFRSRTQHDQDGPDTEGGKASVFQNASALASNYGRSLDCRVMALDPFYVLTEIFRFFTCTEAQFLLMMRSKLEQELDTASDSNKAVPKTWTLFDLDYNRACLNRHIRQLIQLRSFVASREDLDWPKLYSSDDECLAKHAEKTAKSLLKDIDALSIDAHALSSDFNAGMNLLMNSAMTDESQRAIAQAERVAKLTALAFFFIPLSFTATIFGMNFSEFMRPDGKNKLSIWVWVLTSFVVISIAYLFLNSHAWRLKDRLIYLLGTRKEKSQVE